jgi:hypothetical protein
MYTAIIFAFPMFIRVYGQKISVFKDTETGNVYVMTYGWGGLPPYSCLVSALLPIAKSQKI